MFCKSYMFSCSANTALVQDYDDNVGFSRSPECRLWLVVALERSMGWEGAFVSHLS